MVPLRFSWLEFRCFSGLRRVSSDLAVSNSFGEFTSFSDAYCERMIAETEIEWGTYIDKQTALGARFHEQPGLCSLDGQRRISPHSKSYIRGSRTPLCSATTGIIFEKSDTERAATSDMRVHGQLNRKQRIERAYPGTI